MVCFNVMLGTAEIREHIDRGTGTVEYILSSGEILVYNESYNKEVAFHVNVDGVWKNIYTSYFHSLLTGGGRIVEVWKVKEYGELLQRIPLIYPTPSRSRFQLAVFYHNLDGDKWYWDNNYGQDYFLPVG